jgi:hypothetical protein
LKDRVDPSATLPARKRGRLIDLAPYGLTVGAVLLAWQVAIQPLMQRAPAAIAVRIAPGSPMVLRRAAEEEFAAERPDNAAALARDALARAPFDVRALRVVGLTEARAGRATEADDILTLAGNWSLRDDPTHAWLVEHRLRRGDYASSFAHADTLVRRREDIRPQVFKLFTTAATHDRERALPVIARLLAARPPWRQSYLDSLYTSTEGLQAAASLAVMLQSGRAPLTNAELRQLYLQFLDKGQIEAVRTIRSRLNRPAGSAAVTNGDFSDPGATEPFQWHLAQSAGVVVEIVPDDIRPANPALRVDYNGFSASRIVEQMMFLSPGPQRLTLEARVEAGDPATRLAWTVTCAPGDRRILLAPATPVTARDWTPYGVDFSVPANCPSQWLRLEALGGERHDQTTAWLDRVAIAKGRPAPE